MMLSRETATVGTPVAWTATGLPPRAHLAVWWETLHGAWAIRGEHFLGTHYRVSHTVLGTVTTTATGGAHGTLVVPAGFGGPHFLGLVTSGGALVAEAGLTVLPTAEVSPSPVPLGGFVHVTMTGLGTGPYDSQYGVSWDHHYLGNVSAVTTDGTARFAVRAETLGPHILTLDTSSVYGPYLNHQQSPYAYIPDFAFPVTVTAGTPTSVADPGPPVRPAVGSHLVVTPGAGVVGQSIRLTGRGLPPRTAVTVWWDTVVGNRVTATGYRPQRIRLTTVRTAPDGTLRATVTVPDDVGGPPHPILVTAGGKVVARSTFRIWPRVVAVGPDPLPAGQTLTVKLTGVGWTEYDNIYSIDVDGAYAGYVCGFNSHGDVTLRLTLPGPSGPHFLDLYPSVYKGPHVLPNRYGLPQLTYAQDHPGDRLPAFHLVVSVAPPAAAR